MSGTRLSLLADACDAMDAANASIRRAGDEMLAARQRRIRAHVERLLDILDDTADLPWEVQRTIEALAHDVGIYTPDIRR